MPSTIVFKHDDSNGDNCHYNLEGLTNSESDRIFKDNHIKDGVYICDEEMTNMNSEEFADKISALLQ